MSRRRNWPGQLNDHLGYQQSPQRMLCSLMRNIKAATAFGILDYCICALDLCVS